MSKTKILAGILLSLFIIPTSASALEMPNGNEMAEVMGITAPSYIVVDNISGKVVMNKNEQAMWVPASLTKLITLLVITTRHYHKP